MDTLLQEIEAKLAFFGLVCENRFSPDPYPMFDIYRANNDAGNAGNAGNADMATALSWLGMGVHHATREGRIIAWWRSLQHYTRTGEHDLPHHQAHLEALLPRRIT